jgi:hypothetical protein
MGSANYLVQTLAEKISVRALGVEVALADLLGMAEDEQAINI